MQIILRFVIIICFALFANNNSIFAEEINCNKKEVAVTMDNLALEYQDKIIKIYKKFEVPGAFAAITNEDKNKYGAKKILNGMKIYFDNNFIIFNHTANHRNANRETFEEFKEDVISGEFFINKSLETRDYHQTKYFRFPYLSRGKTQEDRIKIDEFLKSRGYIVTPITMDSMDWKFNIKYCKAIRAHDNDLKNEISAKYLQYVKNEIKEREEFSKQLVGRNIKHILLVHGTKITADNLEELLQIFQDDGYKFISLDEAMSDPIYKIDTISSCVSDTKCSSGHLSHISAIRGKH